MGRGVSLPRARPSLGAPDGGRRLRDADGAARESLLSRTSPGALRLHGAGLEKGKSVTVCEISGTKDASVTRKNLLWEQSCRSVIAH